MSWTPWRLLLCTLVQRLIQERTPDDTSPQPARYLHVMARKVEGHTCSYGRKDQGKPGRRNRMAVSRCAVRLGASSGGTTPSVSEAATSAGGVSRTFRKVAPVQREVVSTAVHTTTASTGQPCSQSGRHRHSCRGEEVGECDPGFGLDEPARTAVGRGIEGGPCEDDSASSPGADPVLQDLPRTCQATSGPSRRCDCQGHRARIYVKEVSEGESRQLGESTAWTRFDRKEDGNSSCCCPGCCCTGLQVVD